MVSFLKRLQVCLPAFLLLVLTVALLAPLCSHGSFRDKYDEIEIGMSQAEVAALFHAWAEKIECGPFDPNAHNRRIWTSADRGEEADEIWVSFDTTGRVVSKRYVTDRVGLLNWLRARVGL